MLLKKINSLNPILNSTEGIHITSYIENNAGLINLVHQVERAIEIISEYINPVMRKDEAQKMLEPFQALLTNKNLLMKLRGNIGIFRTKNMFRILNLPVDIKTTCVVATSFHIKPLLKWMQKDKEFLLVGLNNNSASVFQGNEDSFRYVDDALYPEQIQRFDLDGGFKTDFDIKRFNKTEKFEALSDWINDLTYKHKPILFLAGKKELVSGLIQHLNYENLYPETIHGNFTEKNALDICHTIRAVLRKESKEQFKIFLSDFKKAQSLNLVKKNIFEIARAAVQGKVKKLLIAEETNIFGKLDRKTGGLSIHPEHMDHEDDCLLDDLAQEVLSRGGEVVVAKKDDIPSQRPILALMNNEADIAFQAVSNNYNRSRVVQLFKGQQLSA